MALNEGSSFVVSSIVSLLLFSGMQMFKTVLASTQMMTILAGFTGSILYVFLLTAVANLEKSIFGFNFQTKLGEVRWTVTKIHLAMMLQTTVPVQVVFCLLAAMSAAGTVHRVSATTCLLFSVAMTWSLHKISQDTYGGAQAAPAPTQHKKKK